MSVSWWTSTEWPMGRVPGPVAERAGLIRTEKLARMVQVTLAFSLSPVLVLVLALGAVRIVVLSFAEFCTQVGRQIRKMCDCS
jgi:hypothetical protein